VSAVVLIPVKAFRSAKLRLAAVLDTDQRLALARWTAGRVVAAAGDLPVFVACDDDEVATWAGEHHATVLWHPGVGLNAAVSRSVEHLAGNGVEHVVVSHGDLARPTPLPALVRQGVVTLVPDRVGDGTNVIALPSSAPFTFAYGAASFTRHLTTAIDAGIAVRVVADPLLALDIDTPDDLAHPLVQEVLPPWLPTSRANRA
jgi:2-phospho-L-lactate/phosphoenolpyruvate guanylyltransferase